jgi:hypothetical protein
MPSDFIATDASWIIPNLGPFEGRVYLRTKGRADFQFIPSVRQSRLLWWFGVSLDCPGHEDFLAPERQPSGQTLHGAALVCLAR